MLQPTDNCKISTCSKTPTTNAGGKEPTISTAVNPVITPTATGAVEETFELSPEEIKTKRKKEFIDYIEKKLNMPFYKISVDTEKGVLMISRPQEDRDTHLKEGYPFVTYDRKISDPYVLKSIKDKLLIKDNVIKTANGGNKGLDAKTDASYYPCGQNDFRFIKKTQQLKSH